MGHKEKRRVEDDSKVFGLSHGRVDLSLTRQGRLQGELVWEHYQKSSVWTQEIQVEMQVWSSGKRSCPTKQMCGSSAQIVFKGV